MRLLFKGIILFIFVLCLTVPAFSDELLDNSTVGNDVLPMITVEGSRVLVEEQPAIMGNILTNNASTRAIYTVGGIDLQTYYYIELNLPSYISDADGGTIRLIMQHETDGNDQVRIIDLFIGTEYNNDNYGRRGRYAGRYGWTRQAGGGDHSWILGDSATHEIASPWDWVWILDYKWRQGNAVLGGDRIRVYSHPHVTTRVIFID